LHHFEKTAGPWREKRKPARGKKKKGEGNGRVSVRMRVRLQQSRKEKGKKRTPDCGVRGVRLSNGKRNIHDPEILVRKGGGKIFVKRERRCGPTWQGEQEGEVAGRGGGEGVSDVLHSYHQEAKGSENGTSKPLVTLWMLAPLYEGGECGNILEDPKEGKKVELFISLYILLLF